MKKSLILITMSTFLLLLLPDYALAGDYYLPDTGINKCYNQKQEITCPELGEPFYGQDAQFMGPQPAYEDNKDGTVTDLNTGLMWQQGDSQNDAGARTWQEANDYCATLTLPSGVYSDWRIPNCRELISLSLYDRRYPAITTTYFPNCLSSDYWSSSPQVANPNLKWCALFSYGYLHDGVESRNYVRCVRGKPTPAPVLHDNDNGTITDSITGLVWQKDDTQNDSGGRSWEEALDYCNCLTLADRSDWRLPNIRELESIVDWQRSDPAINTTYFPNCRASFYWSNSTRTVELDDAWYIYFWHGSMSYSTKVYCRFYVRCVRGGPFEHYVEESGDCGGLKPCYSTIQAAINATAGDGDIIKVGQGPMMSPQPKSVRVR